MRRVLIALALGLAVVVAVTPPTSVQAQGWTPPIGIPDPGFCVPSYDPLPTLPSPWTSSTANFYYVKDGGSQGANGWPASPRGTVPNPVPAGSVVVIDNTVALNLGTTGTWVFAGSSGSKAWAVSSGTAGVTTAGQATVSRTGDHNVSGTYFVIDGIDFFGTSSASSNWSVDANPTAPDHGCVRHSTIRGNPAEKGAGSSNAVYCTFCVFYDIEVRDQGNWQGNINSADAHGIAGLCATDVWFVDSRFFHNQGDGIQVNCASPSETTTVLVQRLYFGRNEFHHNLQTGLWFKNGRDCIVSENTFHDHLNGGSSAPFNTGGQYLFTRIWWIYNTIYDGDVGIGLASWNGNNEGARDIYLIGNVITNHVGSALSLRFEGNMYVVGNTIADYDNGMTNAAGSGNTSYWLIDNVFWSRNNGANYEIDGSQSFNNGLVVKTNLFPGSPRFLVNGTTFTTLASFEAGDATNRSGGTSGSDPNFISPVTSGNGGNWRVNTGSPAIDTGILPSPDVYQTFQTLYGRSIRVDKAGTTRPQNSLYDKGAYEFVAGGSIVNPGGRWRFRRR